MFRRKNILSEYRFSQFSFVDEKKKNIDKAILGFRFINKYKNRRLLIVPPRLLITLVRPQCFSGIRFYKYCMYKLVPYKKNHFPSRVYRLRTVSDL
jgi:hypothetical protein